MFGPEQCEWYPHAHGINTHGMQQAVMLGGDAGMQPCSTSQRRLHLCTSATTALYAQAREPWCNTCARGQMDAWRRASHCHTAAVIVRSRMPELGEPFELQQTQPRSRTTSSVCSASHVRMCTPGVPGVPQGPAHSHLPAQKKRKLDSLPGPDGHTRLHWRRAPPLAAPREARLRLAAARHSPNPPGRRQVGQQNGALRRPSPGAPPTTGGSAAQRPCSRPSRRSQQWRWPHNLRQNRAAAAQP